MMSAYKTKQNCFSIGWRWPWLLALSLVIALALTRAWVLASGPALPARLDDWLAHPTTALPLLIEPDDARWEEATPLYLPLHAGSHGPLTAEVVELRALYDVTTIAFRARWQEATSAQAAERFALIWHKDDLPDQRGQACGTACHVAKNDRDGGIQAVVPSFVPAGREDPMLTQAIWRDGLWTVTWSRPLHSSEARDIQFIDLSQRYRVRVKVFLDLNHKPDLLTEDTYLLFAPSDDVAREVKR